MDYTKKSLAGRPRKHTDEESRREVTDREHVGRPELFPNISVLL